jgi:hypothetical protein
MDLKSVAGADIERAEEAPPCRLPGFCDLKLSRQGSTANAWKVDSRSRASESRRA